MVDVAGQYIAPGFLDIQVNGCFGVDFSSSHSDDIEQGIALVRKRLLEQGVTGFCPTIITSAPERYHEILPKVRVCACGCECKCRCGCADVRMCGCVDVWM